MSQISRALPLIPTTLGPSPPNERSNSSPIPPHAQQRLARNDSDPSALRRFAANQASSSLGPHSPRAVGIAEPSGGCNGQAPSTPPRGRPRRLTGPVVPMGMRGDGQGGVRALPPTPQKRGSITSIGSSASSRRPSSGTRFNANNANSKPIRISQTNVPLPTPTKQLPVVPQRSSSEQSLKDLPARPTSLASTLPSAAILEAARASSSDGSPPAIPDQRPLSAQMQDGATTKKVSKKKGVKKMFGKFTPRSDSGSADFSDNKSSLGAFLLNRPQPDDLKQKNLLFDEDGADYSPHSLQQEAFALATRTWATVMPVFEDWSEIETDRSSATTTNLVSADCRNKGYHVEEGLQPHGAPLIEEIDIFEKDKDVAHYAAFLNLGDHTHFVCDDPNEGPVVVTISTPMKGEKNCRAIVCTQRASERVLLPAKEKMKALHNAMPTLANVKLTRVKEEEMCHEMLQYEQNDIVKQYKFGILYIKEGQSQEDDYFANTDTSPVYNEFLGVIGDMVALYGWQGFRGGLDVKNCSTGDYSVYTHFREYDVMFHVATLLPFSVEDTQQLERKRHLGNDIVVIIFKESKQPFDPLSIHSHFNHIFIVIEPVLLDGETHYRIAVVCKPGVMPMEPFIPGNKLGQQVLKKGPYFREFLLAKVINAERTAMYAPEFKNKMSRTRKALLTDLLSKFTKTKGK
eukprot:TRINITY_DN14935_c0_g1_i1.p1 TRINITY_DN14935_c0_g1~~TRINITY_DN14935_c0_g1_i1.p1  ORF type:complete len:686 (+),score=146.16 TRINITY_DN14935_c0_g1_i1:220-2277(+)